LGNTRETIGIICLLQEAGQLYWVLEYLYCGRRGQEKLIFYMVSWWRLPMLHEYLFWTGRVLASSDLYHQHGHRGEGPMPMPLFALSRLDHNLRKIVSIATVCADDLALATQTLKLLRDFRAMINHW
jgi:hypothetical protein